MPIVDHPSFFHPSDVEGKLWRYTDLIKFLSLLNNSAIYLTNLVQMASSDPYEGILPAKYYEHRDWKLPEDLPDEILKEIESGNPESIQNAIANRLLKEKSNREKYAIIAGWFRRACFLNCWHHSKFESSAMWQIYAQKGFGIAIKTSVSRMKAAFKNESKELYLGTVQYKDYENYFAGFQNFFSHIVRKRPFFKHEQEVRLVHWGREYVYPDRNQPPPCPGIYAACKLEELIEEIVVSPYEPTWVFDEVKQLVGLYRIDINMRHSALMKPPSG